jgi:hypothetical protein
MNIEIIIGKAIGGYYFKIDGYLSMSDNNYYNSETDALLAGQSYLEQKIEDYNVSVL